MINVPAQAMDVGALTPTLWGWEEREKLMTFYERACGSRLHAAYFRTGGVHQDIDESLIDDIYDFCDPFLKVVDDLESLLTDNRIFKQRNVDIGIVSKKDVLDQFKGLWHEVLVTVGIYAKLNLMSLIQIIILKYLLEKMEIIMIDI